MSLAQPAIFVAWPSAPLTSALVHTSIAGLGLSSSILSVIPSPSSSLIQWASYDCIDHALTASEPNRVLSSSYTIRKALIRKHFLARCIQSYLAKRPGSSLANAVPLTWDIDIAYADELEEMWSDEIWDLGTTLDANTGDIKRWFILKPGMADRGMGIRLFDSKDALHSIFQEFDCDPDDDEADETTTSVMTSQLRHFVLQEYISVPLLVDPNEVPLSTKTQPSYDLRGHKFHLRTYVVASGALTVFMYDRILALFSAEPYHVPIRSDLELTVSLTPHLTNTSLQTRRGEENVRLLDELIGCRILSGGEESRNNVLNTVDVAVIKQQIADTLSETFKAALDQPIHFQAWWFAPLGPFGSSNSSLQPLPNAFELYGADFLVSHEPVGFQVKLLEMNSEPAIELTGPRLTWILEDLFKAIGIVCVQPFVRRTSHEDSSVSLKVGETLHNLRKCLDIKVRASMAC